MTKFNLHTKKYLVYTLLYCKCSIENMLTWTCDLVGIRHTGYGLQ